MTNLNELKEKAALAALKHYGAELILHNAIIKLEYIIFLLLLNKIEELMIKDLGSKYYSPCCEYFFTSLIDGESLSKRGIECFDIALNIRRNK